MSTAKSGGPNVHKGARPTAGKLHGQKSSQKVAKPSVAHVSAGKMASVPGVTLGTTKGNTHVGHATKGSK